MLMSFRTGNPYFLFYRKIQLLLRLLFAAVILFDHAGVIASVLAYLKSSVSIDRAFISGFIYGCICGKSNDDWKLCGVLHIVLSFGCPVYPGTLQKKKNMK